MVTSLPGRWRGETPRSPPTSACAVLARMRLFPGITGSRQRTAAVTFASLIALAALGWIAARQIRSPAQVAADTAPPTPSQITVPVVRRSLASQVIVRGTVRYGAPQAVVLGTSQVKQGSGLVTRPPRPRATLRTGDVAMTVDGRPVFVLPGAVPMHRALHIGDFGPDVRQLERALAKLGFSPGRVDGRYDRATAAGISAMYLSRGWDPMGPTDAQREQLRTAQSTAAQARDTQLQAQTTLEQAASQSSAERATARRAYDGARQKLGVAKASLTSARGREAVAKADSRRDRATADTDVQAKRAAFKAALDNQEVARARYNEVPRGADASEAYAASAELRQAGDTVRQTKTEVATALTAAQAVRATAAAAVARAHSDVVLAKGDASVARADVRRTRLAAGHGKSTATLQAIVRSDAQEARRTSGEVARLSSESSVQVPANEILFFASLPLRVDTVTAKRGSAVAGPVMRVTNSRLAIDSSLEVSDAKLVRLGDPVTIDEQDLGVTAHGAVSQVAETPGTNRVDPSRFYMAVVPDGGFPSLVGTSVKLTIAVKSTRGSVLAVPPSALSVGGDGNSRVQVRRNGQTQLIKVVPGLAAENLVEVRPAGGAHLDAGDLVVVGAPDAARRGAVSGQGP